MSGVLLLNACFTPIKVVSTQRAIIMLMSEKAEVIEEREEVWHSPSTEIHVPSVIRLKRYIQIPYRGTLALNRKNLSMRDKGKCAYCKKFGDTIDHVQPRSRGGLNKWENVVLACRKCNSKKSDKLLSEVGWTLDFAPWAPKGTVWLLVGQKADPDWQPYLGTEAEEALLVAA